MVLVVVVVGGGGGEGEAGVDYLAQMKNFQTWVLFSCDFTVT